MATRFYLPSTGSAPVTAPALPTGWVLGDSSPVQRKTSITKIGSALTDSTAVGEVTASVTNIPIAIYISDPLNAQTISGTLTAVIKGFENNAGADDSLQVGVYVIDGNGATVQTTLYGGHTAALNTTVGALGQEWIITSATRIIPSTAFTSDTVTAGERLMIIMGYRTHDVTTTNRTTALRFGDAAATDFALTAGLTTDLNPWVELSANITFQAVVSQLESWGTLAA